MWYKVIFREKNLLKSHFIVGEMRMKTFTCSLEIATLLNTFLIMSFSSYKSCSELPEYEVLQMIEVV